MVSCFKDCLFKRNILVRDNTDTDVLDDEDTSLWCSALMLKFGYNVVSGKENMTSKVFAYVSNMLNVNVPPAFYYWFPESVKELTDNEILFDRLFSYYKTYGLNDFSEPVHSVLEDNPVERVALLKSFRTVNVEVVNEEQAEAKLNIIIMDMLKQSRPLSADDFDIVLNFMRNYSSVMPEKIGSKDTVIKLLINFRQPEYAKFLTLKQFPDFVEELNFEIYHNPDVKKLKLRMPDRRLVTKVLRKLLKNESNIVEATKDCLEKRQIWKGILHHIHYKVDYCGDSSNENYFFKTLYNDSTYSVSSLFEQHIKNHDVCGAVNALITNGRGTEAYRHLNYITANAKDEEDLNNAFWALESVEANPLVLIQLYNSYADELYKRTVNDTLTYENNKSIYLFKKHNLLKKHEQTQSEYSVSRTKFLDDYLIYKLRDFVKDRLGKYYRNHSKVYQVYIDPKMSDIALPLNTAVSNSGIGNLPCGSKIDIPEDGIIRVFTYWEKVNDIDLSALLYTKNMQMVKEYSWRCGTHEQKDIITFSGDQTSGYNGGSEYFDVDIDKLRKAYPGGRYLIFNDNVFSGVQFKDVICKAGFMIRDKFGSGEVYEPKTVQTSWTINAASIFCHLFAIDLENRQMIWLNLNPESMSRIAGNNDLSYLLKYLTAADSAKMNIFNLFSLIGIRSELDECVGKYDLVITPEKIESQKDSKATYITPQDTELIMKYVECK